MLGNNLGRSRAKNLHKSLGELHGLNVTYQPMDIVGLSHLCPLIGSWSDVATRAFAVSTLSIPASGAFAHVTPIGLCLFVCCSVARVDLVRLIRVSAPFILVEIVALFIVTYFPQIVVFIPHSFGFK